MLPAHRARAGTGVVVTAALGSGGHAMGGGAVLALAIPLGALLLLGPVWFLTKRERRWPAIAALLLGGQLIVHVTAVGTAAVFTTPHAGHHLAHDAGPALLPSGPMLAFHVLAAALVGWWLRLGERRLWQAARRATSLVGAAFCRLLGGQPALVPYPAFATTAPEIAARPRQALLRHVLVLRGPPGLD